MTAQLVDALIARALDRQRMEQDLERGDALMFEKQMAFVLDDSPRKAAHPGRRAGKTEGDVFLLHRKAQQHPGKVSVFIGLTKQAVRDSALAKFRRLNALHRWSLRFSEKDGQLEVHYPNGHRVWLAGCPNRSEAEKFRGADQGYVCVVIDEAGSMGSYLEYLVEDVIDPALADQRGQLVLTGTPPPVPSGYFYEVTTGSNGRPRWPTYHWTMLDNPHMQGAEYLRKKCEANGWEPDHPTYRREWLGQWVNDVGALVYPFDPARNALTEELHPYKWRWLLSMDYGFTDATAWVAGCHSWGHPQLYIMESEARSGLIPSAVAARTEAWRERYEARGRKFSRIVGDIGGLGKAYATEAQVTFGIDIEPAAKAGRRMAIEQMRGDLLAGMIKVDVSANRELIDEWSRLVWTEDRSDIEEGYPDHLSDAALYLHRTARVVYKPEENPPPPGSPEAVILEAKRRKEARRVEIAKRANGVRWRRY